MLEFLNREGNLNKDHLQTFAAGARPTPGRSLGGVVSRTAAPIRAALNLLSENSSNSDSAKWLLDSTPCGPGAHVESELLRLQWMVLAISISHALIQRRASVSRFEEATRWFFGTETGLADAVVGVCGNHSALAERKLGELAINEQLLELLPYVLEPHGHVTRSQVENCVVARGTRESKRESGVYYTPIDLADFMVASIAQSADASWLDPSCGTGVFLRSIYRRAIALGPKNGQVPTPSMVFGVDRSALATDLSAMVLLAEYGCRTRLTNPYKLWKRIKSQLVCMDALRLVDQKAMLDFDNDRSRVKTIHEAFPALGQKKFTHVVMNPPYASQALDAVLRNHWPSFSASGGRDQGDAHIAFTEMLWRFTDTRLGNGAAVLPLSIGANTTTQYLQLRKQMVKSGRGFDFLFFDREPQALFGEDIKTRNVVIFCRNAQERRVFRTSHLLKWTAAQRPSIFSLTRLVEIDPQQCESFIPKIGSQAEAVLYQSLKGSTLAEKSVSAAPNFSRDQLRNLADTAGVEPHSRVLVSSTAYNFVSAYFPDALPEAPKVPFSSSPLNVLTFKNVEEAYAGYALLSTRLCFWLWHVEGDGFHVTSDFLSRLPLWAALTDSQSLRRLSALGRKIWAAARLQPVHSVNAGRLTLSFHAGHDCPAVSQVEELCSKAIALPLDVPGIMEDFVRRTVAIDGKRGIRRIEKNK